VHNHFTAWEISTPLLNIPEHLAYAWISPPSFLTIHAFFYAKKNTPNKKRIFNHTPSLLALAIYRSAGLQSHLSMSRKQPEQT